MKKHVYLLFSVSLKLFSGIERHLESYCLTIDYFSIINVFLDVLHGLVGKPAPCSRNYHTIKLNCIVVQNFYCLNIMLLEECIEL